MFILIMDRIAIVAVAVVVVVAVIVVVDQIVRTSKTEKN